MPIFQLDTNVSKDKINNEFLKSTSKVIAKTLGKPESYVIVQVNPDQSMIFGGSDEPCGFATLMSIGQLGVEQNKKHSAAIFSHLNKFLGIPNDRLYISYVDAPPSAIGYNSGTFHDLLGGK